MLQIALRLYSHLHILLSMQVCCCSRTSPEQAAALEELQQLQPVRICLYMHIKEFLRKSNTGTSPACRLLKPASFARLSSLTHNLHASTCKRGACMLANEMAPHPSSQAHEHMPGWNEARLLLISSIFCASLLVAETASSLGTR